MGYWEQPTQETLERGIAVHTPLKDGRDYLQEVIFHRVAELPDVSATQVSQLFERQKWNELAALAHNGNLDELTRKRALNDSEKLRAKLKHG